MPDDEVTDDTGDFLGCQVVEVASEASYAVRCLLIERNVDVFEHLSEVLLRGVLLLLVQVRHAARLRILPILVVGGLRPLLGGRSVGWLLRL